MSTTMGGDELDGRAAITGQWRDDADVELHGLDEDGGDFAAMALEDRFQRIGVVCAGRNDSLLEPGCGSPAEAATGRALRAGHQLARRWMLTSTSSWWPW
jgi:hypothetical protein